MAKLLICIAPEKFRDEEFNEPTRLLKAAHISYDVASTHVGVAVGMFGTSVTVDVAMRDVNPNDYDGIIFVGGQGTPFVRQDPASQTLAQTFNQQQKLVAAICWAPTILALAGVLQNRKATVWDGDDVEFQMTTSELLAKHQAIFTGEDLTIDGNIITANGPTAAPDFGQAITAYFQTRGRPWSFRRWSYGAPL